MPNNELQLVVQDSGLPENKVQELMAQFSEDFNAARKVVQESRDIVVTSEDQVEEMQKARAARLTLKTIRVTVENTRKRLKEQSLREGKAIDGAANIIKALIVPVEEHLEKQEKFAEVQQKLREEEMYAKRIESLTPYVADISVYDLRNMSKETFQNLLDSSKKAFEAAKAAEKQAEADRLAREEKEKAEQERMRKENEKLRIENEKQEKKLAAERLAKQKLEQKIQKEKEERAAKEAEEAERKRKLLTAPDKDKLLSLALAIEDIQLPTVVSPEARATLEDIKGMQSRFVIFIRGRARNL